MINSAQKIRAGETENESKQDMGFYHIVGHMSLRDCPGVCGRFADEGDRQEG